MDLRKGAFYVTVIGVGFMMASCSGANNDGQVDAEATPAAESDAGHAVGWSYEGAGAPALWGDLEADYAMCKDGTSQSPIDIDVSTVTRTDLSEISFDYRASPLTIVNNGHTIQVNYAPGSSITVADKRYDLLQYHFHAPSEHTIDGNAYDMVVHLVHQAEDGQLGVVGVMFAAGESNETIATLWEHMPAQADQTVDATAVTIDAADLLPSDLAYFNYSGSLTTPPCSEDVNWMVLATPVTVSAAQVAQFTDLFPLSARPVQPLNGRTVLSSN